MRGIFKSFAVISEIFPCVVISFPACSTTFNHRAIVSAISGFLLFNREWSQNESYGRKCKNRILQIPGGGVWKRAYQLHLRPGGYGHGGILSAPINEG